MALSEARVGRQGLPGPGKTPAMTHVERFRALMNFIPVDRLPAWEWAMWWDQTIDRWHTEGLEPHPKFGNVLEVSAHFGLDPHQHFWFSTTDPTITRAALSTCVCQKSNFLSVKDPARPKSTQIELSGLIGSKTKRFFSRILRLGTLSPVNWT